VLLLDITESNLGLLSIGIRQEHREDWLLQLARLDEEVHEIEAFALGHLVECKTEDTIEVERCEWIISFISCSNEITLCTQITNADIILTEDTTDLTSSESDSNLITSGTLLDEGTVGVDVLTSVTVMVIITLMHSACGVITPSRWNHQITTTGIEDNSELLLWLTQLDLAVICDLVDHFVVSSATIFKHNLLLIELNRMGSSHCILAHVIDLEDCQLLMITRSSRTEETNDSN